MFQSVIYHKEFISLLFANMFFWMSNNFFLPVLPIYYQGLGMSDHQIGLAIGAFSVGAVIFRVYCGKLADRYGSKPVLTVGVILSTFAIISYCYSTTLCAAVISRFLHGVGISVYSGASLTMATFMHDEKYTTEAVAIYTLFTMFGVGIAAGSANWLYSMGSFLLVVTAGAVATILSLVLFPKNPVLKIIPKMDDSLPLITVLSNPSVYIPTISLFAINLCFAIMMTFLPLFFLSRGITDIQGFYVAYAVAVVFSRMWVAQLCAWCTPQRLAVYILLSFAISMIVTAYNSAMWILILTGAVIGAGYGLAFPCLATIITANTQPANRATAFGFFSMAVDVGFAVGAMGMGVLADIWGYQAVFLAAGVYTVGYTILYQIWFLRKL